VLTINEQREILGQEPIEGGDMFYLQLKGGTQAKVDEEVLEDVEDESDQNTTNIEIETDGKL
jgi:hypothetical protein